MTRQIVNTRETEQGREPDYDGAFDDAVYWDDDKPLADNLGEGKVSIVPK